MITALTLLLLAQCPNGQCPPRVVYNQPTLAGQTTFQSLEPVDAINPARAQRGLPPLAWSQKLNAVAMERAKEYAIVAEQARVRGEQRHGMRFHRAPDGTVAAWNKGVGQVSETLCWADGMCRTNSYVVAAWDQSPTHAPILYGQYTAVGMASTYGPDGTRYTAAVYR